MINKLDHLHKDILSKGLWEILFNIQTKPGFKNFYLAGGTALALVLGHRSSVDLDLFSPIEFDTTLVNNLKTKYKTISLSNNSIELDINGNKVFFFFFAFPLVKPLLKTEHVCLADPIDIGLMKLLALQGRSSKKDIIDLYYIDKEIIPLEKLLSIFEKTYPKESFNAYSSIKNLINIDDLRSQPMPVMTEPFDFDNAFNIITNKLITHIDSYLK